MKSKGQVNAEEFWTFIWYNDSIKTVPIEQQEKWHYFPDHDVAFWRNSWNDDATAFAFKAGPPEGHAATEKIEHFPDWRLSSGHAHPDAGSFIIWSNGKYLTGDSGYAGVPLTIHHNTLLFDGKGQAKEGKGHDAFSGVPYERLNKIRFTRVDMNENKVSILADVTSAYEPEIGVKKFIRRFDFSAPGEFTILDDIQTSRPSIITAYIHADNKIEPSSNGSFILEPDGKPSLLAQINNPAMFTTTIEKNILTAPGKPGSVDKGEREERGVRLAISTKEKLKKAKIKTTLEIQNK